MHITQPQFEKYFPSVKKQNQEEQNLKITKLSENLRSTKLSENQDFLRKTSPSKSSQISTIYNRLHRYIDSVQNKIQDLLQKQSNEYKIVYQHHYKKFKEELFQLKIKTQEQQRVFQNNQHVKYLESELKKFIKMAEGFKQSYQNAKKQNDRLKSLVQMYKKDLEILNLNAKNYLKQIKILSSKDKQAPKINQKQRTQAIDSSNTEKQKQRKIARLKRSNSANLSVTYQPEIKINFSKQKQIQINDQLLPSKRLNIQVQKMKNWSQRSNKKKKPRFRTQITQKALNQYKNFNACKWFQECVQSVRKEVFHRRTKSNAAQTKNISNKFKFSNSLQDFMKIDKFSLLTLFLSHNQLISLVYQYLKNSYHRQEQGQIVSKRDANIQQLSLNMDVNNKFSENNASNFQRLLKMDKNDIVSPGRSNIYKKMSFNITMMPKTSYQRSFYDKKDDDNPNHFSCLPQTPAERNHNAQFHQNQDRGESPINIRRTTKTEIKKNEKMISFKNKKDKILSFQFYVRKKNFIHGDSYK